MLHDLTIFFYISYGALWILVISQSLILLGLVQVVHQLQKTGVTASSFKGKEAPEFSAKDLSGAAIASANFTGRLTGLLFVSASCQACLETLQDDIEYLYRKAQGNIIVICQAGREDCARLVEQYGLTVPMVADEDNHISQLYGISSIPTVVFVSADNRILSYGHPKEEELVKILENAAPLAPQATS
jgi:peroxiredoxin